MKIYLEYVLIENLIINFVIINHISIFTKFKIKKLNHIISVIILSCYTVAIHILQDSILTNMVIKMLVVNVSIYIAFLPNNIVKYVKQLVYFYLISFMYLGIIISLTLLFSIPIEKIYVKILIYILSNFILYLFNKYMWKMWKSNIKENDLSYNISIKGHEIQAFVDTGNSVKDYIHNLDVIFIENKWYEILRNDNLLFGKEIINVSTIHADSETCGYVIKDVKITKNGKIFDLGKALFVFVDRKLSPELKCNALIGYDTYIEKLKGASL